MSLASNKKISKLDAGYSESGKNSIEKTEYRCSKCKFNLGDERSCHIVEGKINNEHGISKFLSPKGDGILPGDIAWNFIKRSRRKLSHEEGYVIDKGAGISMQRLQILHVLSQLSIN
jgi:hypothetical protein